MKQIEALKAIKALSQETRLEIIRYLVQCGRKGATAGEIGEVVGATASRMSFHLSTLENASLVSSERQSRHIVYKADFTCLGGLFSFLLNDCCGNHPDITACCLQDENCC